ncbi:MAG: hypothetical protein RL077_3472 [Verrucomicrobiota bacterium]
MPTPDGGVAELVARRVKQGGDGSGGEEEGLGLAEGGVAGGGLEQACGGLEMLVVVGAEPTGFIMFAGAGPHFQEGERIDVISEPIAQEDIVIHCAAGIEDGFRFLLDDSEIESEGLAPHLLNGLGDGQARTPARIKEDLETGKIASSREAGVSEELAGGRDIGRGAPVGGVASAIWGRERDRGEIALHDVAREFFAIEGEGQGVADARVGERPAGAVEAAELGGEKRPLLQERGPPRVAAVSADFFDWEIIGGEVELAGAKHGLLRIGVIHGVEAGGLEVHVGAVPVGGGADQFNMLARLPCLQEERAVTDEIFWSGPRGAAVLAGTEFFDGGGVDWKPSGEGGEGRQIRYGIFEVDFEGEGIFSASADGGEIRQGAQMKRLSAADNIKLGGVLGAEGGGEDTVETIDEVRGGDRVAVRPASLGAQVEGPREAVARSFPAGCRRGPSVGGGGIEGGETLQESEADGEFFRGGGEVGVEVTRFAAKRCVQGLSPQSG